MQGNLLLQCERGVPIHLRNFLCRREEVLSAPRVRLVLKA